MTMPEAAELKWPRESHPWADESRAYRRRVRERALAELERAPWRSNVITRASNAMQLMIDNQSKNVGEQIDRDAIAAALHHGNLISAARASGSEESDPGLDELMLAALIGEAAATLLCARTEYAVWAFACNLWSSFDGALVSFRARLQSELHADRDFRGRFDLLADAIIDQAIEYPTLDMDERDRGNLVALLESWRKAKDLRSVWAGLPQMRHAQPSREADTLIYVYLSVDPSRGAELLDRLNNPYQVWAILTGFGSPGVNRNFAAWKEFMRYAPSCFADDGSWTGKTLEILLLVIAQDELMGALLRKDTDAATVAAREDELKSLTSAIGALISEKPQGAALGLRWGAWLFWISAGNLDPEGQQFPTDLRQKATPPWRMLDALVRSDASERWNRILAPDAPSEDVLYLLCAKVLAANERNSEWPDREPLWRCLPDAPEDFLGERGRATRGLTSLFSTPGGRPDGLKFRTLSMLLLQGDPVELYHEFWKRSLTVRELAEHWQTGDRDDGRTDAKQALGVVLAVGLCLVDFFAVIASPLGVAPEDRSSHFSTLFGLVYDSLREVQAIELFDQNFWSSLYTHLLIRRALYENARAGDVTIAAPMLPNTQPTLANMLANIAGVSPPFFQSLDSLIRNGISTDRVAGALKEGGVDLPILVQRALHLNEVDALRPLQIEAAAQIADRLSNTA
jgi:hypothetical protein